MPPKFFHLNGQPCRPLSTTWLVSHASSIETSYREILNPFTSTGTLTAEIQLPGPGGTIILQRKDIISGTSDTFTLGIGVDLVVILQGKQAPFPYELPFLRLYTQLTSALVSIVENKWNTHPSFSHLVFCKTDGCQYLIITINVTRSRAASIYKVEALSIDWLFLDTHLTLCATPYDLWHMTSVSTAIGFVILSVSTALLLWRVNPEYKRKMYNNLVTSEYDFWMKVPLPRPAVLLWSLDGMLFPTTRLLLPQPSPQLII